MDRLAELKSGAADYEKKTAESRALIVKILDEMSFVETDAFVSGETDFGRAAGEGVISGYGSIGGSKVCIFSQNISVFEGGLSARAADKIVKVMTNAGKCGAPLISIFDTKGARIDGGIDVLEGYAKILKAVSDIDGSALHIAVVKGSNYGMLSAAAQMADFCIMYDKAVMAPLSPLVLSQGKDASDIGSAKALSESGECTHVVKSDEELSALIYKLVNYFGGGCGCGCGHGEEESDDPDRTSLILGNKTKAKDIITEIADKDSFIEFCDKCGRDFTVGLATFGGDNAGVAFCGKEMTAADAEKYLKLLNICDSFNLPLINFVDNEGISVKNSGGCMAALKKIFDFGAFTEVPKISVITGSAVGAGYSAFAAKGMGYGYTLAWADANIGIVSGQAQARLEFPGMLGKQEDRQAAIAKIESKINDMQNSALTAARSGFIDNVIDPALSRPYIISALRMLID